ncbi:MAG: glycosyltransferase [Acidobacteria bacterium]|nr:glycosyltransferase [Acidobacteriota bacterium]NIM60453.1 glycosyltransferase [Acidobacteriota bacterium]NIO60364.1 glycosyltransferase [Acidobacteriota bacterium]NIQ31436.1 glycosyltransferase [Acidobacteriota bacterium]NIQ86680.1 glycosyltransferase [Acidobacteriota bacterium]
MNIAYITAGGAGMFCGSCMRDNTLAAALHRMGSSVTLVPTFTPIRIDEDDHSIDRVFLGGINVYLEQKSAAFRHLPRFLRRALDHPRLLRLLSKLSLQQRRSEDGAVALSLLRGEEGHQQAEIRDLVDFIEDTLEPDLVNLTNLLIAGFVPALKRRRDVPVVVTLQGDDVFLDTLDASDREAVLVEMRRIARSVDGFVVFNRYYRDVMADLLEVDVGRFHIVPLGLAEPESFHRRRTRPAGAPPTVGYLARICPEKGFHVLVDALLRLRELPGMEQARLRAGGWLGGSDQAFFERERNRLAAAGVAFDRVDLPDRAAKIDMLSTVDVFSVPTVYREPKGIYVLESLAAGVPVVLPRHGAFPELLSDTGGGRLVPPNDPDALAHELHALLLDPTERRRLGDEGRQRVCETRGDGTMARETLCAWERVRSEDRPE